MLDKITDLTISVRRIANGFVVSSYGSTKDSSGYAHSELTYAATEADVEVLVISALHSADELAGKPISDEDCPF